MRRFSIGGCLRGKKGGGKNRIGLLREGGTRHSLAANDDENNDEFNTGLYKLATSLSKNKTLKPLNLSYTNLNVKRI